MSLANQAAMRTAVGRHLRQGGERMRRIERIPGYDSHAGGVYESIRQIRSIRLPVV
jgi:hypothetical protein